MPHINNVIFIPQLRVFPRFVLAKYRMPYEVNHRKFYLRGNIIQYYHNYCVIITTHCMYTEITAYNALPICIADIYVYILIGIHIFKLRLSVCKLAVSLSDICLNFVNNVIVVTFYKTPLNYTQSHKAYGHKRNFHCNERKYTRTTVYCGISDKSRLIWQA